MRGHSANSRADRHDSLQVEGEGRTLRSLHDRLGLLGPQLYELSEGGVTLGVVAKCVRGPAVALVAKALRLRAEPLNLELGRAQRRLVLAGEAGDRELVSSVTATDGIKELLGGGSNVEGPPAFRVLRVGCVLRAKLLELLAEENVLLNKGVAAGGFEVKEFEGVLVPLARLGQPLLVGGSGRRPSQLDQVRPPLARALPVLIGGGADGARWWRRRRRGGEGSGVCGEQASAWDEANERAVAL